MAGGAPVYPGILVFQNAFASFSQTTSITTTGTYYDIAAGYIDGDNWLDVAAAGQGATGGLRVWRNSFGSWIYSSSGLTTTNTFRGVALDDVDLDGKPELVASRFGFPSATGGGVFIYKYDANTNTWSLAPNQIALTGSYYKLKLNDLNNDGWLDLIAGGGSTTGSAGPVHVARIGQRFRGDDLTHQHRQCRSAGCGRFRSQRPAGHRRSRQFRWRRSGLVGRRGA